MTSKWNGKQCPLCAEGTLRTGKQKQRLEYRGHIYEYTAKGAFCDHCHDGFPDHDALDEDAWLHRGLLRNQMRDASIPLCQPLPAGAASLQGMAEGVR